MVKKLKCRHCEEEVEAAWMLNEFGICDPCYRIENINDFNDLFITKIFDDKKKLENL